MTPAEARAAFARFLQQSDEDLDLVEGALLIAAEEYPQLRPSAYQERVVRMAGDLQRRVRGLLEAAAVVDACNAFIFEELGFRGNQEDYYDPRNSYLNEVLDRRVGIPITLAVVYVGAAARAGLPFRGVGMPGHFLVKYAPTVAEAEIFIDPFHQRTLTREECAKMLQDMYGESTPMRPSFLNPTGTRQILARILNNLKAIYLNGGDLARALAASDRIVMTDPHLTSEWRDRGVIEFQMHRDIDALRDLSRYLGIRPVPEDADRVRQLRGQLLGRLN